LSSARTPAFVDGLGYGRSVAERSLAGANYASLLMRIPAGIIDQKITFVVPEPKKPTGGAVSVYEHDTWIFTVARLAQNEPPADLAATIRMAVQLAPPALLRALKRGEPLGEVAVFRYPGCAWRRYDQCSGSLRGCSCSATRFAAPIPATAKAVLSAAENSPAPAEKLFRSMNLIDPPIDCSWLLR
jgi:hypothetical protein